MKVKINYENWLRQSAIQLLDADIESAHLDSLIILEDTAHLDRAHILAHPEEIVPARLLNLLNINLERRLNNEPLAYIRGFCEFYGRRFNVNRHTLIPRPESEAFIDILNSLKLSPQARLLDIGTGCGVLAITAKLEQPKIDITALDICVNALKVAKANALNLNAKIEFIKTDFLGLDLPQNDIIFANLPYVPQNYKVSAAVKYEPAKALYAKDNGLFFINQLAPKAYKALKNKGYILIESMPGQQPAIRQYYINHGFEFVTCNNLVQCFKKP